MQINNVDEASESDEASAADVRRHDRGLMHLESYQFDRE